MNLYVSFRRTPDMISNAMPRLTPWLIAAGLSLTPLSTAQAHCVYKDEPYARTTLAQEFENARQAVRVRVLSANSNRPDNGRDEPSTLYEVEVLDAFKGSPARRLAVFTFRNSGGFYMDRGPAPDIGGEYLLFLDPAPAWMPTTVRGAAVVHYSCGQSRRWDEVEPAARATLQRLRRQA